MREIRLLDFYLESLADMTSFMRPAIVKARKDEHITDTAYCYAFRKMAATLGYNADPYKDLDLEYCKAHDITVIRGFGGGVTFGPLDFIIAGIVMHKSSFPKELPDIFKGLLLPVCETFKESWGIDVKYRPMNDMEVDGKKFTISGVYTEEDIIDIAVGVTIKWPSKEMVESAIPPPPEKFADKKVASIEERTTDLETLLGRDVNLDEVREVIIKGIEKAYDVKTVLNPITWKEIEYERELRKKCTTDEWFYCKTEKRKFGQIPTGIKRGEKILKMTSGPLVRATVLVDEGKIRDILLTGHYIGVTPFTIPEDIENALKGIPIDERLIGEKIEEVIAKPNVRLGFIETKDFVKVIMEAAEKAS